MAWCWWYNWLCRFKGRMWQRQTINFPGTQLPPDTVQCSQDRNDSNVIISVQLTPKFLYLLSGQRGLYSMMQFSTFLLFTDLQAFSSVWRGVRWSYDQNQCQLGLKSEFTNINKKLDNDDDVLYWSPLLSDSCTYDSATTGVSASKDTLTRRPGRTGSWTTNPVVHGWLQGLKINSHQK